MSESLAGQLRTWVLQCSELTTRGGSGFDGERWQGSWPLLARHGHAWEGSTLPDGLSRGPMGGCYTNAWAMARKNPELAYCEGVAMAADLPIPLSHAWCLHIPTMTVIETTWEAGEGTAYLGLVFPDKTVKEALRLSKPAGIVSILDGDWARRGWFHQRDNAQTAISRTCELTGDPLEGIQAEANKAGEPASGKGAKQRKRKGAVPEAEQSRGASIT